LEIERLFLRGSKIGQGYLPARRGEVACRSLVFPAPFIQLLFLRSYSYRVMFPYLSALLLSFAVLQSPLASLFLLGSLSTERQKGGAPPFPKRGPLGPVPRKLMQVPLVGIFIYFWPISLCKENLKIFGRLMGISTHQSLIALPKQHQL